MPLHPATCMGRELLAIEREYVTFVVDARSNAVLGVEVQGYVANIPLFVRQ